MIKERRRFKEILSILHFSDNAEVSPREHPEHERVFKVRWFINHLNERFLKCIEPEKNQNDD